MENLFTDVLAMQALWMVKKVDLRIALSADPTIRVSCVAAAQKHFSLDEGVAKYRNIYDQING